MTFTLSTCTPTWSVPIMYTCLQICIFSIPETTDSSVTKLLPMYSTVFNPLSDCFLYHRTILCKGKIVRYRHPPLPKSWEHLEACSCAVVHGGNPPSARVQARFGSGHSRMVWLLHSTYTAIVQTVTHPAYSHEDQVINSLVPSVFLFWFWWVSCLHTCHASDWLFLRKNF